MYCPQRGGMWRIFRPAGFFFASPRRAKILLYNKYVNKTSAECRMLRRANFALGAAAPAPCTALPKRKPQLSPPLAGCPHPSLCGAVPHSATFPKGKARRLPPHTTDSPLCVIPHSSFLIPHSAFLITAPLPEAAFRVLRRGRHSPAFRVSGRFQAALPRRSSHFRAGRRRSSYLPF